MADTKPLMWCIRWEKNKKAENLTIPLRVFRYITQYFIGRKKMTALIKIRSGKSRY